MHAPSIISSDTDQTKLLAKARGFAESLLGFIAGLEGLVGQFLIPNVSDSRCDEPDTQARRRRRWPERNAKNSHRAKQTETALSATHRESGVSREAGGQKENHGGISANEFTVHRRPTAPLITFQNHQNVLINIRRVEYTLRCFILWLVAQIIERAHETGLESFFAKHQTPQRERYEEIYGEGYIPPMIRQQDRELRDNLSDKVRLSSFSVTTPLILSGKRKTKTHRRYRLLPDQLREVDARFILARIERLGKALKRADVMAERLAVRALQATAQAQRDRAAGEEYTRAIDQKPSPLRPTLYSAVHLPRSTVEDSKMQRPEPSFTGLPGEVADRIYSGLTEGGATNPLYFKPFQNWLPPPELYETGDEDEREVMNDLHFLASSGLKKLGFDPPKPISPPPDFDALKEPQPPHISRL